ncbi:hypothetical protein AGLY_007925 [Aphis glycines]|uniref:Uncharacterized protein n=1 Tax=Aphis glycines TaxID=307491 RepID=A0A6G0TNZ5_APHGL|nr:hypothetical protein AGLY_007925 [Aphis glycines]
MLTLNRKHVVWYPHEEVRTVGRSIQWRRHEISSETRIFELKKYCKLFYFMDKSFISNQSCTKLIILYLIFTLLLIVRFWKFELVLSLSKKKKVYIVFITIIIKILYLRPKVIKGHFVFIIYKDELVSMSVIDIDTNLNVPFNIIYEILLCEFVLLFIKVFNQTKITLNTIYDIIYYRNNIILQIITIINTILINLNNTIKIVKKNFSLFTFVLHNIGYLYVSEYLDFSHIVKYFENMYFTQIKIAKNKKINIDSILNFDKVHTAVKNMIIHRSSI